MSAKLEKMKKYVPDKGAVKIPVDMLNAFPTFSVSYSNGITVFCILNDEFLPTLKCTSLVLTSAYPIIVWSPGYS